MQEINNTLIKKIKEMENDSQIERNNQLNKGKKYNLMKLEKKKLIQENIDIKESFKEAQNIIKVINAKYDTLMEVSALFEEKSRDVFRMNQLLKEKLINLCNFK